MANARPAEKAERTMIELVAIQVIQPYPAGTRPDERIEQRSLGSITLTAPFI
jgi:hypothetical protein